MKKKKKVLKKNKESNLTIHFMPYSEIAKEDSLGCVKKIIGLILKNRVIILQGRLKPEEESKLIEHTMSLVGNLKDFNGIEIAALSDNCEKTLFEKIRRGVARILVGEQDAITVIGPASVVKEIKKDPKKMEMLLKSK